MIECSCAQGVAVILALRAQFAGCFLASHGCSHCGTHLFDTELKPGEQVIATENIASDDGHYVIPKGQVLRITAFVERSAATPGFAFCGLLAAGGFSPERFAAVRDLAKRLDRREAPSGG